MNGKTVDIATGVAVGEVFLIRLPRRHHLTVISCSRRRGAVAPGYQIHTLSCISSLTLCDSPVSGLSCDGCTSVLKTSA